MSNIQRTEEKSFLPLLAIAGPTASGKTALSLALAEMVDSEIICVDAMQVYRGLDVGTAKPTWEERSRVIHHGIDLVSPLENFSASKFDQHVEPILLRKEKEKKPLILCGGTGLYYRSLLEGFFVAPDPDPVVRTALRKKMEEEGLKQLARQLEEVDPETAKRIHVNDARRIIRALEIIHQTGKTVTELRQSQKRKPWMEKTVFIGIDWERNALEKSILERTEWMYKNGLIEETKKLMELGCNESYTVMQALGYKECFFYLKGCYSLNEAIEKTFLGTKRYAKRQMTWFRNQCKMHWILARNQKDFKEIVNQSLQLWKNGGNNI